MTGEAATNPKVIAEKERIRKSGGDEDFCNKVVDLGERIFAKKSA